MARKKRTSGEGTAIEKRKDGRWWARVTVNGERICVYGKSEKECKEKRDAILEEARKGTYIKPTKELLGEWLDEWLEKFVKPSVRATTFDSYYRWVNNHIKSGLGKIKLVELRPEQIQAF